MARVGPLSNTVNTSGVGGTLGVGGWVQMHPLAGRNLLRRAIRIALLIWTWNIITLDWASIATLYLSFLCMFVLGYDHIWVRWP